MNPLITRILLSIILWPIATVCYFGLIFIMLVNNFRDYYAFIWSNIAVGFCVVVCWWLLWRSWVNWTPWRIRMTGLALIGCISIGLGGSPLFDYVTRSSRFLGYIISGPLAVTLWPLFTILIWRETPLERARRSHGVNCPNCGYDLTGLRECRCPECGQQYTVDELYSKQPQTQRSALPVMPETL